METKAKGLTILVIMTALCALVASASAPPTPFMIYGYVFYENGDACNNPTVNITNTNTSNNWSATINASYNYYQLMLTNGTDVNASEILQFNVTSPDGNQSNITEHTVMQENITDGGLFNFNISLEALIHDINVSTDYTGTVDGVRIDNETGKTIPAGQNLIIEEKYYIKYKIVNGGDFNESVNITVSVSNATGWNQTIGTHKWTIKVGASPKYGNDTWDTTGLSHGNYNITVNASIPVDDDWSNNERARQVTLVLPAAPNITDWYNNRTKDNSTEITINESECVFFNATADQAIDVWSWFVNGTNQSHNFDNFSYCDWTVNGTYYVEVNGTNANGTSNTVNWTVTVNDITPPTVVADSNSPTGTDVPVTTNITANFSESMNASTLNTGTILVENSSSSMIEGNITYNSTTKLVTFDPLNYLECNETYNVTITTGVQDLAENNMSSNFIWNFTTSTPPSTTVSIANVSAPPGGTITVPIMVNNVTNLGSGTINVSYNSSVVYVTDVTNGTGNALVLPVEPNIDNSTGLVRIFAWNVSGPLNDSVIFANVTYKAVGNELESTTLNITVEDLTDYDNYTEIPHTVSNGTFTIIAPTKPVPSNIGANTTEAGTPVLFHTYWTSDVGLANYTFAWNDTGVWKNVSFGVMTGTGNWSNVTMTLNTTLKTIGWRIYCNDTSGNLNETGIQILTINDTTPPVPANIEANTTEAGMPVLFSAYWTDDVGLVNYTFAWNDSGLWINDTIVEMTGTGNWSNITKTLNTTLKTIGWRIYCNDTSGNLNDTGIQILTINDTTPPVPSNIGANTTEAGMPVLFHAYWTDNVGLANYTFAWNDSGVWENESVVEMAGTESWSNVTKTLNTTLKTIGWRIYCNDTSGNLNDTGEQILTINDTTKPVPANIEANTTEAGMPVLFHAYWTDDVGLANYTFAWNDSGVWENKSVVEMTGPGNWSNVTETLNTTLKTIGWRIYANDTSGNLNDTGEQILTINDTVEPVLSNASANPATILNDNGRARPPGTNVSRLNVTVIDTGSGIANVTINLSVMGGSPAQPLTHIGGTDNWTVTTNASSGINETNYLVINATDEAGNSNISVNISLIVLRRGDVVRNDAVDVGDAFHIAMYLVGKVSLSELDKFVADVVPAAEHNGITSGDALYIAKNVVGIEPEP